MTNVMRREDWDALVISKDLAPNDNLIGWFVGGRRAEEMRRVAALRFAFPSIVAGVWGRVCEHPATGEVRVVIFVRWCLHAEEEAFACTTTGPDSKGPARKAACYAVVHAVVHEHARQLLLSPPPP